MAVVARAAVTCCAHCRLPCVSGMRHDGTALAQKPIPTGGVLGQHGGRRPLRDGFEPGWLGQRLVAGAGWRIPNRICEKGTVGSPCFFCGSAALDGPAALLSCGLMTTGHRLLSASAALFLITFAVRAASPVTRSDAQHEQAMDTHVPTLPATTAVDYLGSASCARCHQEAFDQWQRSLHIQHDQADRRSDGGRRFQRGRRASAITAGRSSSADRRQAVRARRASAIAQPETFAVDYTLGAKRYQGYLSTLPDGRIYVLPAFWHIESRRWVDWKEITPIPDGAHDLRQIWNTNCFNCHATNMAQGFDVGDQEATRRRGPRWASGAKRATVRAAPHVDADGRVGEESGVEAGVRQQRLESRPERHPEDLLAAQRHAAPDLRHLRVLPRQQAEHVHRVPRRRSL